MNLEDRIARRLKVEGGDFMTHQAAAEIAALEAEHPANLMPQTQVVPNDAMTEIAPPDVEALLAAFNRHGEGQ